MTLRAHAAEVLRTIANDTEGAFGWPIVLTAPDGFASVESLVGRSQDIAQVIDPDTGQPVSGRLASASLVIQDILDAGYTELPRAIANTAQKPWLVTFDDINGVSHTFKVSESNPDRTLGVVNLLLECYVP